MQVVELHARYELADDPGRTAPLEELLVGPGRHGEPRRDRDTGLDHLAKAGALPPDRGGGGRVAFLEPENVGRAGSHF